MMRLRLLLAKLLLPIMRLVPYLGQPEPRGSMADYRAVSNGIMPGDVLLSREDWRLSNLLINGFWSHAAIYIGKGMVLEAVPVGVRLIALNEFILSLDSVAHLRAKFEIEFRDLGLTYVGAKYDFEFLSGNQTYYCSELVNDYLKRICVGDIPFKPRMRWGIETSTPQDFANAIEHFEVLYERR